MYWGWRTAVGKAGVGARGLKLDGGPHWKPATNNVSPAAPARPCWEPASCWRPVCAVPQPAALVPNKAPPTAIAARPRKRRLLVSEPLTKPASVGSAMSVGLPTGSFMHVPPMEVTDAAADDWSLRGRLQRAGLRQRTTGSRPHHPLAQGSVDNSSLPRSGVNATGPSETNSLSIGFAMT